MNRARSGLAMDERLFAALVSELARRGNGERESGAFLLAQADHASAKRRQQVIAVAYYDDLDPGSLTGGITFTADGYTALAALCRHDELRVAGDIHTHPGGTVRQSAIDAAHPMTALPGHIALIAPRYARDITSPADLGVHVLQNGGQWASCYGPAAARAVRLTKSTRLPRGWVRATGRHLRRVIRFRRSR